MQEEVNQRTVALSIKAAKLTSKVLALAILKSKNKVKAAIQKAQIPQGRQTVKQLGRHYGDTKSMQYVGAPRNFDRIAKEFNVNYAFYKTDPGHYLLFFKAKQEDEITAAFSKYAKKTLGRTKEKPSIVGQLRKYKELSKSRQPERQRVKRAVREER